MYQGALDWLANNKLYIHQSTMIVITKAVVHVLRYIEEFMHWSEVGLVLQLWLHVKRSIGMGLCAFNFLLYAVHLALLAYRHPHLV